MKFGLKVKLEKLVNQYQKEMKEAFDKVKEIEASQLYTADAKGQMIRDIKTVLIKADHEYNQALKDLIQVEKSVVINSKISKPADYQNMLGNTLNQINMLGDKLTDNAAYDMVKPFFGDYETMHNLYSVISNRYGKDSLNVSTRTLGWLDGIISKIDNLTVSTKYFFNAGSYMSIGLNFIVGLEMILGEAEEIDSMGVFMEDLIKFKFEETKISLENKMFGKGGAE